MRMGKKPKPPIFEIFPHFDTGGKEFIVKHLDCFTVEMLWNELISVVIPKLVEEAKEDDQVDSLMYKLLQDYTSKPPSYSSVLRLVHIMGFNYSTMRKSYMVDGHKHPA